MHVLMVTQAVDLDNPVLGFTHTWVNALARQVEQLHVVTLVAGRHHLADNVVLHAYGPPGASHNRLRRFWFYNKCFARLILGDQIDGVFVHMVHRWVVMAAPYTYLKGIPIVLWYAHRAVPLLLYPAHCLAKRVVTCTPEGYRLSQNRERVHVVGHGIDTEQFRPVRREPDGFFRVLSVGRLSPIKHYEVLIEAARILVRDRGLDNLQVRIVGGPIRPGDAEYVRRLKQTVVDHNLERHIVFTGPVPYDKVIGQYQGADLVVNLCPTGALDKAALEAMACGLPLVTVNSSFRPLFPEELKDLCLPQNNASAIADAIAGVAALPLCGRHQHGLDLRRSVEQQHSLDRLMGRIVRVFEQLTPSNPEASDPL